MLAVEPATLAAFAVPAAAAVLTPGPDTVLILRYSLGSGRRIGLVSVAGVQAGLAVHTLLAAAGISAAVAASPVMFRAVSLAGAAYIAWLGWQGLRGVGALDIAGRAGVGAAKGFRDAMLCNLLNPKVILLFLALFPQFVEPGRGGVPAQLVTLAAALLIINTLWQAPLAWGADAARRWLGRPAVRLAVSRGTGGVFLALAVLLFLEHVL